MSERYTLRPRADRDLDEIADYYADESGIDLSLRFVSAAHATGHPAADRLEVPFEAPGAADNAGVPRKGLREDFGLLPADSCAY